MKHFTPLSSEAKPSWCRQAPRQFALDALGHQARCISFLNALAAARQRPMLPQINTDRRSRPLNGGRSVRNRVGEPAPRALGRSRVFHLGAIAPGR